MTIDEKLSHFYDITVEEAHEKAAAILDEHKAALEKMAEEHKTLSEEKRPDTDQSGNCQRPT